MFGTRRWKQAFADVLGMNRRNLEYVYGRNPRALFPLVDDKIRCKGILREHGLPTPATIAHADTRKEIDACLAAAINAEACVIKPACGFGGSGIKAVTERLQAATQDETGSNDYREKGSSNCAIESGSSDNQKGSGTGDTKGSGSDNAKGAGSDNAKGGGSDNALSAGMEARKTDCTDADGTRGRRIEELRFHMASILSGMYSFDSLRDRVLVEEFVIEHPDLRAVHGGSGVSDMRVIICDGEPVMAMLRVPSEKSRPTANLHRGGVGIGIDFESGRSTFGVCRGRPVSVHPDTQVELAGIEIPYWSELIEIVKPLNQIFGLGYLGVDVVIHAGKGPMILELNARPGLTIQLANRSGLRLRLERSAIAQAGPEQGAPS